MSRLGTEIVEKRFQQLTSEHTGEQNAVDDTVPADAKHPGTRRLRDARIIPYDLLERDPTQPRTHFDEEKLQELQDSIAVHGILSPISVRFEQASGKYIIVHGERRWIAAGRVSLKEMPCYVSEISSASTKLARQLIENHQREDLSPIDFARGLFRLKSELSQERKQPVEWKEVEHIMGINERRRRQFTSLLELPEDIQKEIVGSAAKRGKKLEITERHARALLLLAHDPKKQRKLFDEMKNGHELMPSDQAITRARALLGRAVPAYKFMVVCGAYKTTVRCASKQELLEKLAQEDKKIRKLGR